MTRQPSDRRRRTGRACGAALLAFTLAAPVTADTRLPDIGNPVDQVLSPQDEALIGRDMFARARQRMDLNEDPQIAGYIDRLGNRLAGEIGGDPVNGYTFFVVQDARINAFAAPGGYIGINSGLFLRARNESQLAGVMAHEIAHVSQRHIARAFAAGSRNQYKTVAAIVAGLLLGGQVGQAAMLGGIASEAQRQINYTRSNEYEADRIGIRVLADAGFQPQGMTGFFEILRQEAGASAEAVPEYLRTHPLSANRIAEASARAEQMGDSTALRADSLEFHLMQARLEILTARDPQSLYGRWSMERMPETEYARTARRYGLALLETRLGETGSAIERLQALRQRHPDNLHVGLALAGALAEAGRVIEALETWDHLAAIYPRRYPIAAEGGELLLRADRAADAIELLTDYIRNGERPDPGAWRRLAEAAEAAGQTARSHEALGEYYARTDRFDRAIQQFRIALDAARPDSPEAKRLDSRLEQVRDEQRALMERNPLSGG
ncbi:MAG: M48 family metalloprotease [Halofilum sp. (in: g-proteobacteria)]|nr:M48 family metalloprotease [Halofilum sp. (in: g-proteobacteria)]